MFMLDLSGGNVDRSQTYIAPNGVVVQSSAPTYVNNNFYYLAYLFNKTYTNDWTEWTSYWLTSSSGNITLIFNLSSVSTEFYLKKIRVYPRCRNDASSDYRISVSEDGVNWTYVTGWVLNRHIESDPNYVFYGVYKDHDVNVSFVVNFIKFELTRNGSYGSLLSEIELYGVPPFKVMFLDRDGYKSYIDGEWKLISYSLPSVEDFNEFGMSELSILDRDENGNSPLDLLPGEFDIVTCDVYNTGHVPKLNLEVIPKVSHRYRVDLVHPYQKVLSNWSDYYYGSSTTHYIDIGNDLFVSESEHIIEITAENNSGEVTTEQGRLFIFNRPPEINAEMVGLELKATIKDLDSDRFRYKVLLNNKQIIPVNSGEFTDFYDNSVSLSKLLFSREVLIGQSNQIIIVAEDWYGGTAQKILDFTAEYMGLMFADMNNEFYSTDMGEVLKYLEIGPIMAGTSSLVYPIKLINKYPFDVTNITLWQDNREQHDLIIELSETEVPFVGKDRLNIDRVMKYNDEIVFYVRVSSKPSAMQGGLFDIYAKADPLNQSGG